MDFTVIGFKIVILNGSYGLVVTKIDPFKGFICLTEQIESALTVFKCTFHKIRDDIAIC